MKQAESEHYAVGAFNIFNIETVRGTIRAAEESCAPVILQTSVKTVKYYGASQLADLVKKEAEKAGIPVVLHLDHCTDLTIAKKCVDAGWSSIMYDGSKNPLEENIAATKNLIAYIGEKEVSVEGELGAIGGTEEDIAVSQENASCADVESSVKYVEETGVDAFAPAVGTAHGVYKGAPKIDFERFCQIKEAVAAPLVVHGGTGLEEDVFRSFVALGAAKINVSTALKITYRDALKEAVNQYFEPLDIMRYVEEAVVKTVKKHIMIFGIPGEGKNL